MKLNSPLRLLAAASLAAAGFFARAADQVISLGVPTTKAIIDTAAYLKEHGKVEAVLPGYAPYVSAQFITH